MRPLILGPTERDQIAELKAFAAGNIVDAVRAVVVASQNEEAFRDTMQVHAIDLPLGFRVVYTHERQPALGMCHHISISVTKPAKLPAIEAVEMLLSAFGMAPIHRSVGVWLEDLQNGCQAVNVVQRITATSVH